MFYNFTGLVIVFGVLQSYRVGYGFKCSTTLKGWSWFQLFYNFTGVVMVSSVTMLQEWLWFPVFYNLTGLVMVFGILQSYRDGYGFQSATTLQGCVWFSVFYILVRLVSIFQNHTELIIVSRVIKRTKIFHNQMNHWLDIGIIGTVVFPVSG